MVALLIIGYVIGYLTTFYIVWRYEDRNFGCDDNRNLTALLSLLWPPAIIIVVFVLPFYFLRKAPVIITEKLFPSIEKLFLNMYKKIPFDSIENKYRKLSR